MTIQRINTLKGHTICVLSDFWRVREELVIKTERKLLRLMDMSGIYKLLKKRC